MTPFETEALKMFRENFGEAEFYEQEVIPYLLSQLRLARADERKQAYEELFNNLIMSMPPTAENLSNITPVDAKATLASFIKHF